MSRRWRIDQSQIIPRSRSEVFTFFSDPHNLKRIIPDFVKFKILTSDPIEMKQGTIIEYSIALYGVPLKWRSLIECFEAEHCFVDIQLKGPYQYWHHRHEFSEVEQGTCMRDIVDYELPFGPLGIVAHTLFVSRSLERIFEYRRHAIIEMFASA